MSWPDLFNTSCYLATVTENTRTSCIYWLCRSFDETPYVVLCTKQTSWSIELVWEALFVVCATLLLDLVYKANSTALANDFATNWITESFTLYQSDSIYCYGSLTKNCPLTNFGNTHNRTHGDWVRYVNTTSVLSRRPTKSASVYAVKFFSYWSP